MNQQEYLLPQNIVQQLELHNIHANSIEHFQTGHLLGELAVRNLYDGANSDITNKMVKNQSSKRAGNNVLNINILLNTLRKDSNLNLPSHIKELTAFRIIQNPQDLIQFLQWLLNYQSSKISPQKQEQYNEQMQVVDLHFVDQQLDLNEKNDSLEKVVVQKDKISRKGSFKILRPKNNSSNKENTSSIEKQRQNFIKIESNITQPLKQTNYGQIYNKKVIDYHEEKDELEQRKTIPKMLEKPPINKSKYKNSKQFATQNSQQKNPQSKQLYNSPFQNLKNQSSLASYHHSQNSTQNLKNNESRNLKQLDEQIALEQQSLIQINNKKSRKTVKNSPKLPKTKLFKISLQQTNQKTKQQLIQWLISINLLSQNSINYCENLHQNCKDGVIFIEIANYYKGRGAELCYFREPKKPAQMHSNYQKLWNYLESLPTFKCEVWGVNEFFIPSADQNAFWTLMYSLHKCFYKKHKLSQGNVEDYEANLHRKLSTEQKTHRKEPSQQSHKKLKYNSQTKIVPNHSSGFLLSKPPLPKTYENNPLQTSKAKQLQSHLIQNEEPLDQLTTERGYKDIYLSKFKAVETPTKSKPNLNSSFSRSRKRSTNNSFHKNTSKFEHEQSMPNITLEMQMHVLKYLKSFEGELYLDEDLQLFKDPYRNGVLLNYVVKREFDFDVNFVRKPRSIMDCRDNYQLAFRAIKKKESNLPSVYFNLAEEVIKGDKNILMGLIYELTSTPSSTRPFQQPLTRNLSINLPQQSNQTEQLLFWIRQIESQNSQLASLKIRNKEELIHHISTGIFLFYYATFVMNKRIISPNYERPLNIVHKQSNLKKVLGYLVQNKIVRSDFLWKSKNIAKSDWSIMQDLLEQLRSHYTFSHKKAESKTVNFIKYIKPQPKNSTIKPIERLETTMAPNLTINQTPQEIKIPWMRKLGFQGSLSLNDGTTLCRLVSKVIMKTLSFNERPHSKPECLANIRKAIKQIPKFKWDELDIFEADYKTTTEVYQFVRERYRHSYAMKFI